MNEMKTVPPHPVPSIAPVRFVGDRDEFRHLVTRGGLLEIVTLGFYRFWLATDMRRHLWSSTVVDGDSAEYTGRARELLIGFLIAMAVLIPIYLLYLVLTFEAERAQAFGSIPLLVLLYVFGQFAIYRARRYRLTRTVWRGVRFWMAGSGWAYALRASLWGLLVFLTLGLALPWRDAALERYKMRHSYYGDLQASFEGRGSEFFKRAWWLWLLTPTAILIVPAPFIYAVFRAIQWRWWLDGVRFGGVRLKSNLENGALIGLYWSVIGWSVVFSMCIGLVVAVVVGIATFAAGQDVSMAATIASGRVTPANVVVAAGTVLAYLAYIIALNIVVRIYLTRDFWQRVTDSVTIFGLEAAANVAARGELANALGEGFADGLDVGGL